jgi:hypothetical protein
MMWKVSKLDGQNYLTVVQPTPAASSKDYQHIYLTITITGALSYVYNLL